MSIQQTQDYYKEIIEPIDFVEDEEMAEEAIKAVLGILASRITEQEAREFTAELPGYLSYETLRGHQLTPTPTSPADTINIIADKFNIEKKQAHELIQKIIGVAKEQAAGEISHIAAEISEEWRKAIDEA